MCLFIVLGIYDLLAEIKMYYCRPRLALDMADSDGWTALRSAAWGGHVAAVRVLLELGVSVDLADTDGRTALRAAAWGGHEEVCNYLGTPLC